MNELKLEAGKFYKTRNGEKLLCLTTSRPKCCQPVITMGADSGDLFYHSLNGNYYPDSREHPRDLISEWVDAPEVDWSLFSPWVNYIVRHDWGDWCQFENKPRLGASYWENRGGWGAPIPPQYAPKWTGPWQQSLVVRPGKEGK